jgi:hypothetical protein
MSKQAARVYADANEAGESDGQVGSVSASDSHGSNDKCMNY